MTRHDLGSWPVDETHLVLTGIEATHVFPGLIQSVTFRSLTVFTVPDAGAVQVVVDVADSEPPVDLAGWDDVVETTVRPAGPEGVTLVSIDRSRPRGLHVLAESSGTHRLRLHLAGRTASGISPERAHLAFWPAPAAPAEVLLGAARPQVVAEQQVARSGPRLRSPRDQKLVDDMTRRLLERGRRRPGG